MPRSVEEFSPKNSPSSSAAYPEQQGLSEDVIDLRFLLQVLLRWWWFILLVTLLAAAKGVWDMHTFAPKSTASMVVAPVEASAISLGVGARNFEFGGPLAGLAIGAARKATKFDRLVHAASTITLARTLQEKYGLMQVLYGGAWDPGAQTWQQPVGSDFERRERINRFLNLKTWTEPDLEDLAGYLGSSLKVKSIAETSFKKLSFSHQNPDLALRLLTIVYDEATELLRAQDRKELVERRAFLEARLRETKITEFRQALVDLLAGEARREMSLQGGLPYAARILELPQLSKHKTKPNQLRYLGGPMVVVFAGACVLVLLVALVRHE